MKTKGVLEKKNNVINKDNMTKTIILGLVGLILVLIPDTLNKIIGILVGVALLLIGISNGYRYYQNKEDNNIDLAIGILYGVLGVIIMLYPHSVLRLVAICLGVYLLINGLLKLKLALSLKDSTSRWTGTMVVAILIIVLGLLLIFNPFSGIAITKLTGIFLVIVAVFDIIDNYIIRK